jgi:para-aminobenzoate synthetase component I
LQPGPLEPVKVLSNTFSANITAFELFLSLKDGHHPFILDSSMDPTRLGRYSFVGVDPFLTFWSKGNTIYQKHRERGDKQSSGDPFEILRDLLKTYRVESLPPVMMMPFTGGAVGYLGYDLNRFIENIPDKAVDDVDVPDCFFGFYDGIYAIDHLQMTISAICLGVDRPEAETMGQLEERLIHAMNNRSVAPAYSPATPVDFLSNMTKESYTTAIHRIREYIRSGDIYQVNYTQRFEALFESDPVSLYSTLRSINPAPFSAYIDAGSCQVLSSSPERFIRVNNGFIETRPIKGTCPRGATDQDDEDMRKNLLDSEKDRAELLMIVDLERNDLGRIAKVGTVQVPELFVVETYPTVHHLVATITAQIRSECDLIDCLKATFPGGSITGAPKVRAMEIIEELEPTRRNVYTGALGYLGFDGNADLNIVIRTMVVKDSRAYFQAGGAITWDSDAESEYEESVLKAKALREALSSRIQS